MNITHQNIGLVFVVFHPQPDEIEKICKISKKYTGVIVDNTPSSTYDNYTQNSNIKYLRLGKNEGIAKAQNIGIKYLYKDPAIQYIILFDQDSEFDIDLPLRLAQEHNRISQFKNLAALGPLIIQKETKQIYRSVLHQEKNIEKGFQQKDEIIASGCCVPMKVYQEVGLLDENLFIDFVDCEWCFRAESKGYICGITHNIHMNHKVGINQKHIGKHTIIISAPFRYYYQYRNLILLDFKSYVPFRFKIFKTAKALIRLIYFPLLIKNGTVIWKQMIKGIGAGIKQLIIK
jgi:rhamnosyltransferase